MQHASEIAVGFAVAFWQQFPTPSYSIPYSTDQTYELPGSLLWAILSRSPDRQQRQSR